MIWHVVMWTLHDPVNAGRFVAALERCRGVVPGMLQYDVGQRTEALTATLDVCLVAGFSDAAALQAYLDHPTHRAASAELAPLRRDRHVLDFAVPV